MPPQKLKKIVTLIDIPFGSNASCFPNRYSSVAISTPAPTCTTGNGPTKVPAPGSSIPEPTTTTAGSVFDRTLVRLVDAKNSQRCF